MTVAQTILDQMGGTRRIMMMTGAKQFVSSDDGVQFSFKGSRKYNKVVVKLAADDTYTVGMFKIRGVSVKGQNFDGIYADQLVELFERETGLYLTL
jgi:hypothetical protein